MGSWLTPVLTQGLIFFAVRDDDSDYCDGQMMAEDSQINSPSPTRRSPTIQPDDSTCMSMKKNPVLFKFDFVWNSYPKKKPWHRGFSCHFARNLIVFAWNLTVIAWHWIVLAWNLIVFTWKLTAFAINLTMLI